MDRCWHASVEFSTGRGPSPTFSLPPSATTRSGGSRPAAARLRSLSAASRAALIGAAGTRRSASEASDGTAGQPLQPADAERHGKRRHVRERHSLDAEPGAFEGRAKPARRIAPDFHGERRVRSAQDVERGDVHERRCRRGRAPATSPGARGVRWRRRGNRARRKTSRRRRRASANGRWVTDPCTSWRPAACPTRSPIGASSTPTAGPRRRSQSRLRPVPAPQSMIRRGARPPRALSSRREA